MGSIQSTSRAAREAVTLRPVRRIIGDTERQIEDAVAVERWLRITVNGREVAALMASPGHEEELGAGFALTQGLLRSRADLLSVSLRQDAERGDAVRLVVPLELSRTGAERIAARGACGGVADDDADLPLLPDGGAAVCPEALRLMARAMAAAQAIYRKTGGTHAAALFASGGELLVLREDVGRHNALDKVVGHCLLAGVALQDKVLLVSGRASREIAAKAVRARAPILASMSAATDAGVDLAQRHGLTLVSFLRGRRMNICAHAQRIIGGAGQASAAS